MPRSRSPRGMRLNLLQSFLLCLSCCLALLAGRVAAAEPSRAVSAEPLRVALEVWEPYLSERVADGGPLPARLSLLLQHAGFQPDYVFYPFPRTLRALQAGEQIDAAFPLARNAERDRTLLFSDALFDVSAALFFRSERPLTLDDLRDTRRELRVGVIRESITGRLCKAEKFHCVEADSGEQVLRMLAAERVDAALLSREVGKWLLATALRDLRVALGFRDETALTFTFYLAFPRLRPESAVRIERINRALAELRAAGKWSQRLPEPSISSVGN